MIQENNFKPENKKEIYIELKTGDDWGGKEKQYIEGYRIEFINMDMREAIEHGINYNYISVGVDVETARIVLGYARDKRKEIEDPYTLYREVEDFYKKIIEKI